MKWFEKLFRRRKQPPIVCAAPERPASWNLTIDDLFEEMKAGKRKSVSSPEAMLFKKERIFILQQLT